MTTGTRVFGWIFTVYFFLTGLGVTVSGRFIGRKGATIMTGTTARVAGSVFLLIAIDLVYLLRTHRTGKTSAAKTLE